MAVTDAYCTAAEYRAALDKTDTGEDAEVLGDATAVTRYIERVTHRFFTKDASDATRIFVGDGYTTLDVGDLVSVTTIKIDTDRDGSFADETALAATDYELLPLNAGDGSEPGPYRCIGLTDYGTVHNWPAGARVQVIGVFGWPAVPAAIKAATIQITGILRLEGNRGISQVTDLGTIISTNAQARNLISDLVYSYGLVTV
jgi:hypothetical protein